MTVSHLLGQWLAWIVPAAIQLSLLVAVITPVAFLLRRFPAQLRYALWMLVFAKVFITPDVSAPWAVGVWGTIIHWDGSAWTKFPSGTFQRLTAVWGHAPNDVWAVGYANTILHWDGVVWSRSRLASAP